MTEAYSYRGHSIDLDFQELLEGRVRCTYFIDASYCFQAELGADGFEVVRAKAVALAHASIDALDFQCPRPASKRTYPVVGADHAGVEDPTSREGIAHL